MGRSLQQMIEIAQRGVKQRRRPTEREPLSQVACVSWFRLQYPKLSRLLFAVPNGGKRDHITAGKLKAEGAVAGVADLLLLVPSATYHGLAIEMKTIEGAQREAQKLWQQAVEAQGYKYVVCRSLDSFMEIVKSYLNS